MIDDDVQFHYNGEETIDFRTIFMGISDSSNPWYSIYDGFIGLAPYNMDMFKEFSFLYQLKKNGQIDHLSFSIYTREAASGVSVIKFGGYDEEGLAANTKLTVLRTDKNN